MSLGHTATCGNCGQLIVIECDKRQLGGGRKHDADWKPGPNHETVKRALAQMGGWQTVKAVQAFLNHKVDSIPLSATTTSLPSENLEWVHQGKSSYWTQLAVEDPMSDLRGIDVVESMLPAKGREWVYRIREGAT